MPPERTYLDRAVLEAEAGALGLVLVPAARLAYLERVEQAAAHELLMDAAVQRHAATSTLGAGLTDEWRREEVALLTGRRAALDALHAALAARPPAAETEAIRAD